MSLSPRSTVSSNLQLFIDALSDYAKLTGIDLSKDPCAVKLQYLRSPNDILQLLQERENAFREYRDRNRPLISCLTPAVNVIQGFSGILGEAVGLTPFPPAKAFFVGIDILLATARGVSSSYDALLDLFECLGNFLKRLEIYINVPPTPLLTEIAVKIIVELLAVLGLATKQIQQGRFKMFAKKLFGESDIESALQKVDRLTQDEARMAVAQTMGMVHGLVNNMKIVMEDGKASTDSIRQALFVFDRKLDQMNNSKRGELQRDIEHWLSPPDPSTNHDFVWKLHHNGTAAWFFESNILAQWKLTGSLLWIHGKPGSGKSTLLSAIIEDIEGVSTAGLATIAYYYFDFRDVKKQNLYGLLSSLLSQLSRQSGSCHDILSKLYSTHASRSGKPASSILIECIQEMLNRPGQGQIYIILDALDECPNISGTPSAREEVLDMVEELVDLKLPNVHLCVASRPEIDIRMVLEPLASLHISLHDEKGQKEDIINYIKSTIYSDKRMRKWKIADQELVIDGLSNKADGMFRWVVCQIDRLRRTFPASIRSVLDDLPKTLDDTYGHTLLGIDEEKREYAQRLFRCLTVSIRPLRVEELAEIFAFQFDKATHPTFNAEWRPEDSEEAVLSACSSLISIVDVAGFQAVQFSHFSVKEFLTSSRLAQSEERLSYYHILPEPAHAILAHASLSVLLQLDDDIDRETISHFPLALYAARYWVDHVQFGSVLLQVEAVMELLFDPTRPHFAAWVWLHDIDRPWTDPMTEMHPPSPSAGPLYYASFCGFLRLTEHLISAHSPDINSEGGSHTTALHVASIKGHLEVVSVLLANGADPNSPGFEARTPLHMVSKVGHQVPVESVLGIARLLLNSGARVDETDDYGWTPLHTAARNGHREVAELLVLSGASLDARNNDEDIPLAMACRNGKLDVARFLIDRGSDLSSQSEDGMTLLHFASKFGHVDIARLLLDRKADMNVLETDRWTPLHYASAYGHLDVTRLLIKSGAIVDSRADDGVTPLSKASEEGFLDIARFLIESGADLSSRDDEGYTPFHTASKGGHLQVVKFFLECGVDIDIRNGNKETPLDLASGNGKPDVVRFLIEQGADIHTRDKDGWNPLHIASQNGCLDVVKLLTDSGSPVDIRNDAKMTPLAMASKEGEVEVSRFLIERGADMNARDEDHWVPLHFASRHGHLEVIRLFLERGVDLNVLEKTLWTPLHFASRYGHLEVARYLLDHGVGLNVQADDLWAPLHLASNNGHAKIAHVLVEGGAKVDIFNREQETPLYLSAGNGHVEITRFLIEHGANLHSADSNGKTPLHSAAQSGHLEVVKLLVTRGANVDAVNKASQTAAELASEHDHGEISRFLAEYKSGEMSQTNLSLNTADDDADEESKDKANASLITASDEGEFNVVESLLEQGADVNARNEDFETPLELAAKKGELKVVRLLIEWGATVDSRDKRGWTPLHDASLEGNFEISKVLVDHGANVNARTIDHWTPLHLSAYNGNLEIAELLLERGADVHALTDEGRTAYELSLEDGSRNIADLLQKHKARAL